MRTKQLAGVFGLVSLLVAVSGAAGADDRFSISLGAFITDRNTDTQLNSSTITGTDINFETDLGLDSSDTVFRLDGYYKFNDKHRVDFSVFDLSRTSTREIEREIMFGDQTFAVDTTIEVDSDLTIYKAAYTWSFARYETGYAGLTAGFYVADSAISLVNPATLASETGDLTAPLPVIGLRGEYAFNDKWSVRGSAELFAIEFDEYDGSLFDVYAAVDYSINDLVSIGVGVNTVTIDVDVTENNFTGGLDWRYSGALLFLKFDF